MARSSVVTARVGVVIAVALAIAAFAIFSIGHGRRLFKETHRIETRVHRINGLQSGAPVMLSGVNIGAVDLISFPPDPHSDVVIVRMWVVDSALPRIRSDALAEINTMGRLGDKFVEIAGGNPQSEPLAPGQVLASQDPIDYQALLQKPETSDLIANVMSITQSLREMLDQVEKGHGMLSEMIKGEPASEPQLTLGDIKQTFDHLNELAGQMSIMVDKINRGQGVAGAMFSRGTDGKRLLADVQGAAASMQTLAARMNALINRFDQANGVMPRLMEDQKLADHLLDDLQHSAAEMREILRKINDGQGSVGLAVNDPSLYHNANQFLSQEGSIGWGVRMLNGLYVITHPFSQAPAAVQAAPSAPANDASAPAPSGSPTP